MAEVIAEVRRLCKVPDVLDADIIRGIEVADLLYGCHPLAHTANAALIAAELHRLRQSLSSDSSAGVPDTASDYDDISRRPMQHEARVDTAIDVIYHAKPQFERLSKEEKEQVVIMLTNPNLRSTGERLARSGNTVSELGATKRVVWRLSENGKPIVLSVLDREQECGFASEMRPHLLSSR